MLATGRDAPVRTAVGDADRLVADVERLAARVRAGETPRAALGLLAELEAIRPEIRRRLSVSNVRPLWLVRLDRAIHVLVAAVEAAEVEFVEAASPEATETDDGGRRLAGDIRRLVAATSVAGLLAATSAAAADCTVAGSSVNCTGSPGPVMVLNAPMVLPLVVPGLTVFAGPYDGLNVSGLTADITGPITVPGLTLQAGGGAAAAENTAGLAGANLTANIITGSRFIRSSLSTGVLISSVGQDGGEGEDAIVAGSGDSGGAGGDGGTVNANISANVTTIGPNLSAIQITSQGGSGGQGGDAYGIAGGGGDGGLGGRGGAVTATLGTGLITTDGLNAFGVMVGSFGGAGGEAGSCVSLVCWSNTGGVSANGGTVTVTTAATTRINTLGQGSDALHVSSIGGFAGGGGGNYALVGFGASGGSAGNGGQVSVNSSAQLVTTGPLANGLFAQSVGGGGGAGGSAYGIVSLGGGGSQAGDGGDVSVTNAAAGTITTVGLLSRGLMAQSVGGGGGTAGDGFGIVGIGGDGASASNGGSVSVTNAGLIQTGGMAGQGIFAQSVGGGGGDGGVGGGIVGIGGSGSGGGAASWVKVTNSGQINTGGDYADGIFAQSVGGGGGSGGTTGAIVSIGGSGGGGGDAGDVSVTNSGKIVVSGAMASGVTAQSIGGGGGDGGGAGSGGVFFNLSIGGKGGQGGSSGKVSVTQEASGSITTKGVQSPGVFAQSVGGGGGGGGFAAGGSVGLYFSASVGVGGSGGLGGDGGEVVVSAGGDITTEASDSNGVFAQSVGGGGGTGGFSATGALAAGQVAVSASVNVGGSGGGGGAGGAVTVRSNSVIATSGDRSLGVFAQSVGGGGGTGGWTGAVGGAAGNIAAGIGVGVGGKGGGGGAAATASAQITGGSISTAGLDASGVLVQSVGGGGGTGGFAATAGVGAGKYSAGASVGVGGDGGVAGAGGVATLDNQASITTKGDRSYGAIVQSVGGGGGTGGWTGALAVGAGQTSGSGSVGIGGKGGAGGSAATATLKNSGAISTSGTDAIGLFVQSTGGGGGTGGFSVAPSIAAAKNSLSAGVAIGGDGGAAGDGGLAVLVNSGRVTTAGDRATGVQAQSVGGGGGAGGWTGALGIEVGEAGGSAAVSIGGNGAAGGKGGEVRLTNSGAVSTQGVDALGVFAQSVGGGGGSGGFSVGAGAAVAKTGGAGALNIGGDGGAAGDGYLVTLDNTGNIDTVGDRATAVLAQSVGGGGGNGGWTGSVAGSLGKTGGSIGIGIGGDGGAGGNGGEVKLTGASGRILTQGEDAFGVVAQSIGGGGGNGGFSVGLTASKGDTAASIGFMVGGDGGAAGAGGSVNLSTAQTITTKGGRAYGVYAQSIGGGGGAGGFAGDISGALAGKGGAAGIAIGGDGGAGGAGGVVSLASSGSVNTAGSQAHGVFAQSVGGGGGSGGFSVTGGLSKGENTGSIGFTLGGKGGPGSFASSASATTSGAITTAGDSAHGVLVQSVGGGGGSGGFAGSLTAEASSKTSLAGSAALGGKGGTGATGAAATLANSATISTSGRDSYGALSQSIGGGGGTGGFALSGALGGANSYNIGFALGGSGGLGGAAGTAKLTSSGVVTTTGIGSIGLMAQSVGGGGGAGGAGGALTFGTADSVNVSLGIGGSGGKGGDGGVASLSNSGVVSTTGEMAHGLMAESIGGGGGHGGAAGIDPDDLDGGLGGSGALSSAASAKNIAITVGGWGGASGDAGDVDLTNTGQVTTAGAIAHAVYAHSIGGGGGDGGVSSALAGSSGKGKGWNFALGLGGFGGAGGDAGDVTVDNKGVLSTSGDTAYGLFAFSVGGGGGTGGSVRSRTLTWSTEDLKETDITSKTFTASIGGWGGASGDGGDISVTNAGSITTSGMNGDGLHAKSVGGGGGDGGDVSTTGDDVYDLLSLGNKNERPSASINVGGFAGASGDGGKVTVVNGGVITTTGAMAQGIFAQSVGGGGGSGGSGLPGSISIGGWGGAAGNGGEVDVTNNGRIITKGALSAGIFAQSVGGGGGVGGGTDESPDTDDDDAPLPIQQDAGAVVDTGPSPEALDSGDVNWREWLVRGFDAAKEIFDRVVETKEAIKSFKEFHDAKGADKLDSASFQLGGFGGAAGNGAAINITNNGYIETFGVQSPGIFAQSVGGGGGVGGEGTLAKCCELTLGGRGGAAGDGGDVTVTNTGDIVTHGAGSYGIFAQSIGGSGGLAGDVSIGLLSWGELPTLFGGSDYSQVVTLGLNLGDASDGHGGDVTINNTGNIYLEYAGAIGTFAQSVGGGGGLVTAGAGLAMAGALGGSGTGGQVIVNQQGDVIVSGVNGYGAMLQSTARQGGQNITATYTGMVRGGSGLGAGAVIDGGATNTVTFKGQVSAASNVAILSTGGDDTINALGGVRGEVDLGLGSNTFNNGPASVFETATAVKLNGGTLKNDGQVSPGGLGVVMTTQVTGAYVQAAGAALIADLDLASAAGAGDRLTVSGSVDLQGQVKLNLTDVSLVRSGKHAAVLVEGAALTRASVTLSAPDSAVAKFELYSDSRSLGVSYGIDFAPPGELSPNGKAVGDYFNRLTTASAPSALQPFVASLLRVPNAKDLGRIYQSLTPEAYLDAGQATAIAAERFADSMMSCPTSSERLMFTEEGCVWLRAADRRLKLKATTTLSAYAEDTSSWSAGFERRMTPDLRLGLALSADDLQVGVPGVSDGKGKRYSLGVVAKTEVKTVAVSVAASAGAVDMEGQRRIVTPAGDLMARGEQTVRNAGLAVRAAKTFGDPRFYVRPMLEADLTAVRLAALNETAAGPIGLTAPAQTLKTVSVTPRVEIGGEVMIGSVAIRPFARIALNQVVSGARPIMDAGLLGAGGAGGGFATEGKADKQTRDYELGVQAVTAKGRSAKVTWSVREGDRTRSEGFALKITAPF